MPASSYQHAWISRGLVTAMTESEASGKKKKVKAPKTWSQPPDKALFHA